MRKWKSIYGVSFNLYIMYCISSCDVNGYPVIVLTTISKFGNRRPEKERAFPTPRVSEQLHLFLHSTTNSHLLGDWSNFDRADPTMATTISPRLIRLTTISHLSRPTANFTRVSVSRYSTSTEDDIILSQQVPAPGSGHVRVLQLNRPKARNAISRQLLDTLSKQVKSIAAEEGNGPTRALVVASNVDAAFCAGADLKERAKMTHAE